MNPSQMGLLTKQAATPTTQAQLFSAQPFHSVAATLHGEGHDLVHGDLE